MNGAELAAYYAFPPNRLGYCGEASFRRTLEAYMGGSIGLQALEKELKRFQTHYTYLFLIAKENGMKPFELPVVRAFWTGNQLLENVSYAALRRFVSRVPFPKNKATRARMLSERLPTGMLPHHSFNALYINFVTDKAERSIKNYDSCCVTAGTVVSVSARSAAIRRFSIGWKCGFLLEERTDRVALEQDGIRFIEKLEKGDLISIHWGMAIERLGKRDIAALKRYTRKNMEALNAATVYRSKR